MIAELAWPLTYTLLVVSLPLSRRVRSVSTAALFVAAVVLATAAWWQFAGTESYLHVVTWLRVALALAIIVGAHRGR